MSLALAWKALVPTDSTVAVRTGRRSGPALVAALAVACAAACSSGGEAAKKAAPPPDPAQALYAQGKYAEALPLLEQAAAARRTGSLLYQIGYCKSVVEGPGGASKKQLWSEARPLLEQEIAAPGQATLDRLYYLTVISSDDGQAEAMRKYGRQAIDTIEKPEQGQLSGEEWFRLGRIHEFMEEPSEAEAAYRRSVSAFRTAPAANPSYQALALARVGDLELDNRRYEAAAESFAEALKLVPSLGQVRPYRNGVALFGAGRFDDAVAAFGADRDLQTMTESQYAADLARRTKEAGGLIPAEPDGVPIDRMSLETLEGRIKEATAALRAAREKNSYKPGDPLVPEIADRQRRFASLLRERFLQTGELQDFCLREGLADLVRR